MNSVSLNLPKEEFIMKQKRIVTIQDLSCFGKCSITTALPIISALGIETVVLPTAILSNHTGSCFSEYTFHSLEGEFDKIADAWESHKISFDAIYVGYIGSLSLIREVERFIDRFGKDTVVFIDPAMADEGALYRGLDNKYSSALTELCKKADIISPNYTEALIMANCESSNEEIQAEKLIKTLNCFRRKGSYKYFQLSLPGRNLLWLRRYFCKCIYRILS